MPFPLSFSGNAGLVSGAKDKALHPRGFVPVGTGKTTVDGELANFQPKYVYIRKIPACYPGKSVLSQ